MNITSNKLQESIPNCCNNLMIVAHPDDETLWGGAHLITKDWFIICLTNGTNIIRAEEFKKVLQYTSNKGIILDYPDEVDGVRSDWADFKQEIIELLSAAITCKVWDKIATHNPEGDTGHIHHKILHSYVYDICKSNNLLSQLYYFGIFYDKSSIPDGLPKLSGYDLFFKEKALSLYEHEVNPIHTFWYHMVPYENWINSTDWGDYE